MTVKIVSPVDGSIVAERETASLTQIKKVLQNALSAKNSWKSIAVSERAILCHKAIDKLLENGEDIAREITQQMGRPIKYAPGELQGLEERARYMIDIATEELADIRIEESEEFNRYIKRESLGVVLTIAPWNYPYLTAINSIVPALMAGNCVILKHSAQTLLCAERFCQAFEQAGFGEGVFQYLHLDHQQTTELVKNKLINFVSFTGSVSGGEAIEKSMAGLFKGVGLELGGKDPAYVRSDADINLAVENLVDGAFFNSGQSCCGIERIYLHMDIYDDFIKKYTNTVNQYVLGDPFDITTTLGPMVNSKSAEYIREQIKQACNAGAISCIDEKKFPLSKIGTAYLAPQVLLNVDHNMSVMKDESFGPVVGIMKVNNDDEAVQLMNDSSYGLTASIWTNDKEAAISIGDQLQTGTVFMNRCDYLDPALSWVGVKKSGRGCSLSVLGYQQLTRPKSFHLKSS
ncbi:MAG: aldehyde dehydrogenase [endosymbiont of Galathealinum brachiosum]|uniref:Aldehyde dehydrogenase n=1 Tax=endosymbiont of Galathealinum brachiosum TaxID=2200906 RepID=A0A370DIC4_9GAMM|nr:MAG: aldehyde dehydrogenase [endosymbiont of Galathealinum brachiosum]